MKKKELLFVTIATLIIGTLMHFLYEWSGESRFIGYICPVDESVWEHMKLIFYPLFFVAIYIAIRKGDIGRISGFILTSLIAMALQISFVYLYKLFTQRSLVVPDIIFYYIVMIAAVIFGNIWSGCRKIRNLWPIFAAVSAIMIVLFTRLSYSKPSFCPFLFMEE